MEFAEDVDLKKVAAWAEHYTGADLQSLIYSAQLEAIHSLIDDNGLEGGVSLMEIQIERECLFNELFRNT